MISRAAISHARHGHPARHAGGWLAVYLLVVTAPLLLLGVARAPGRGLSWDFSMALGYAALAMFGVQWVLTARLRRVTLLFGIDIGLADAAPLTVGDAGAPVLDRLQRHPWRPYRDVDQETRRLHPHDQGCEAWRDRLARRALRHRQRRPPCRRGRLRFRGRRHRHCAHDVVAAHAGRAWRSPPSVLGSKPRACATGRLARAARSTSSQVAPSGRKHQRPTIPNWPCSRTWPA